jgi:hypothetical protein
MSALHEYAHAFASRFSVQDGLKLACLMFMS